MGQRVFSGSFMGFAGSYTTRAAYESGLLGSSLKESTGGSYQSLETSNITSPQCLLRDNTHQATCEFQDYCNHRYYIDDRCCCATSWKKMTGLVIPTSG